MASNSKPPGREDNNSSNNQNPFITFKKYADEQFASFFQNFIGLPSSTQLHDLERSYFDENGRLKPISDFIDKAVEVVKKTETKDRSAESKQQLDRTVSTTRFGHSAFVSILEEISMDPFERWQKHAERHADDVTKTAIADRCLYRSKEPEEPEDPAHCPYRPAGSSPAKYDEIATITDALGESSWSTNIMGTLSSSDHVTTHRSFFGIKSHTQNVPLDAWPLPYIAMSPYSPLAVENQLRKAGERANLRWRHAFEDLILLNKGYSMDDMRCRSNTKDRQSDRQGQSAALTTPGIDWVSDLITNGIFGNWRPSKKGWSCDWSGNNGECKFQLSDEIGMRAWEMPRIGLSTHGHGDEESTESYHQEKEERASDEVTELDLYEYFLEDRNRSMSSGQQSSTLPPPIRHSSPNVPVNGKAPSSPSEASPPSIISTLTTTERQVLPDGTVHTKVVLKKRFADGREESNEAEHTTHTDPRVGDRRAVNTRAPSPSAQRAEAADVKTEQKPKTGWFW